MKLRDFATTTNPGPHISCLAMLQREITFCERNLRKKRRMKMIATWLYIIVLLMWSI